MGKITSSHGYGHRCQNLYAVMGGSETYYEISWTWDRKYPGSRLRFPRTMRSVTNRRGAEKFCKKWGIEFK